jgi:hypothetical protein
LIKRLPINYQRGAANFDGVARALGVLSWKFQSIIKYIFLLIEILLEIDADLNRVLPMIEEFID